MSVVAVLGPQRLRPTIRPVLEFLRVEGPVAAVTAGWEERKLEDDELAEHVHRPTRNLQLYHRAQQVQEEDREFGDAYITHRREMIRHADLYRLRLGHALDALRELSRRPDDGLVVEARREALADVRRLDTQHLTAVRRHQRQFEQRWRPGTRRAIRRQRQAIRRDLAECDVVAIAGGHVDVLWRLVRLFGLADAMRRHVVLAWSAGAMLLAKQVVLFHDAPPQGHGHPEVLGPGLGLCAPIVPLPHARRRLRLEDPDRVARLAARLLPDIGIAMDEGDMVIMRDGQIVGGRPARQLGLDGVITEHAVPEVIEL